MHKSSKQQLVRYRLSRGTIEAVYCKSAIKDTYSNVLQLVGSNINTNIDTYTEIVTRDCDPYYNTQPAKLTDRKIRRLKMLKNNQKLVISESPNIVKSIVRHTSDSYVTKMRPQDSHNFQLGQSKPE